jgi:HD-GYP domain-containing protein (c-di-GMP phosphodiesterase class II)
MVRRRIQLTGASTQIEGMHWQSDDLLRIGRLSHFEIVLNDASISREHAEIGSMPSGWVVRDLNSTNGTFVNGRRVRGELALQEGDLLACGNVALRVGFHEEAVPEPSPGKLVLPVPAAGSLPALLPGIKTTSSFVRVQAMAQRPWEQAVEMLVLHSQQRRRQGQHFLTLLRTGYHLTQVASLEHLLQSILDETVAVLDAQRGAFVLFDEATGTLQLRASSITRRHVNAAHKPFSTTLAQRCFRQGESLLCRDVNTDAHLCQAGSVANGGMASIVCALLRSPRRRLGVLHLDRGPLQDPFTEDDLCLADAIAASVSVGIECAQLVDEQRDLFLQTVTSLARAVELRDLHTGNHTQRVATYAMLLARELDLSPQECSHIQIGTPLHDIGKIAIDDSILRKPGRLTAAEFEFMKSHTVKGAAILQSIPGLTPMLPIIRHHHERWDGKGYPDGLAGPAISRVARIVAVADAFDAMTSDRPYRRGMPPADAFAELANNSGSHFDPECVAAFLRLRPRVETLLADEGSEQRRPDSIWSPVAIEYGS